MISELKPEAFLDKLKEEIDTAVFFVFRDKECCKLSKNHRFDISIGLELITREEIIIKEGKTAIAPTGVKWSAPWEMGVYLSVLPRSGLSKNTPLRIPNAPGTIEPTYRNEIGVLLECVHFGWRDTFNYKGIECLKREKWEVKIPKGARLAQAVVNINFMVQMRNLYVPASPVIPGNVYFCVDEEIFNKFHELAPTERGLGGYGSTGVK